MSKIYIKKCRILLIFHEYGFFIDFEAVKVHYIIQTHSGVLWD